MDDYDVIVIGGGINSLTTAALLGESGKTVLLLEACQQVGGMASIVEFTPGFRCNIINDYIKWIDPKKNMTIRTNIIPLDLEGSAKPYR